MGRAFSHSHSAFGVIVISHVGHGVSTDSLGFHVIAGIQVVPPSLRTTRPRRSTTRPAAAQRTVGPATRAARPEDG